MSRKQKYTFLSITCNSISLLNNAMIVNVCTGAGVYLLNQTHIIVYLLPNTYVTLRAFLRPLANSNITWLPADNNTDQLMGNTRQLGENLNIGPNSSITWSAADNKTDLLMGNSRQLRENINIGPMTTKLHHMRVTYVVHYKQQGKSIKYVSKTATLLLSGLK